MQWLLRQQVNGEGHGWYPVHALVELVYIIWYRLLNHADYVLATCYLLWHIVNYWFSLSCIGCTPGITCNISSLLPTGYVGMVTHLWGECHIQNFPSMENIYLNLAIRLVIMLLNPTFLYRFFFLSWGYGNEHIIKVLWHTTWWDCSCPQTIMANENESPASVDRNQGALCLAPKKWL